MVINIPGIGDVSVHRLTDLVNYLKSIFGFVTSTTDPVTGGIGILGPSGVQIGGNAAPFAFTSRALAQTDNGMNLVCATARAATVPPDLPTGFGCSFEGAVSFTAGAGVTITDLRTSGATDVFCGLMQVAANTYKVRGGKA